ncbi:MAG: Putative oxidoreductase [Anaerolinea thermophila]|uniref:Putative oxidoreductase n=1 Tax=Anaerolinea thermophila TaxID=167964 RepID=A0A101FXH6_9CHLR|nr:MAG: Putative oxidoreductase [Anaerolinea thermophila]
MKTILVSAPYMLPELDRFRPVFEKFDIELIVPEVDERLSAEEILIHAGKFDGTICGDDRYTRRVIEACSPRLKVISKWGTGIDSIDQTAARDFGILVGNTPNAFTVPVSESVIGYMLAFARQIPWLDDAMKAGRWEKINGKTLSECTLGVVGVGNVGKAVLRRARGFGMALLGNDIVEMPPDFLLEFGVEMISLEGLMARSDFISVNCSLNPTSYHLINQDSLQYCQPTAVLINTARGPIVDQGALVDALQEGRLRGAALDVFEEEPLPLDSPLLTMDQVLLAPHNTNSSPRFWERVHWNTIKNLLVGLGLPLDDFYEFVGESL